MKEEKQYYENPIGKPCKLCGCKHILCPHCKQAIGDVINKAKMDIKELEIRHTIVCDKHCCELHYINLNEYVEKRLKEQSLLICNRFKEISKYGHFALIINRKTGRDIINETIKEIQNKNK